MYWVVKDLVGFGYFNWIRDYGIKYGESFFYCVWGVNKFSYEMGIIFIN